jgi:uncharacterized protein YyaL (SSP411 family)
VLAEFYQPHTMKGDFNVRNLLILLLCLNIGLPGAASGAESSAKPKSLPTEKTAASPEAIVWHNWSDDIFARAKAEKKFVILDLEAVWCHWCHVMDERTYSNSKVQSLMNEHYIAVRVDQDSRPDLSNKYEDYGWPATIIFAADGKELVKHAGFIPPDEMVSMLTEVVKDPTPGPSVRKAVELKYSNSSSLSEALRKELQSKHVKGYDSKYGSWSTFQKFLDWDSVEYAMSKAKAGDAQAAKMASFTLDQQLNLLDPVWGGIYQYSTDGVWTNPHFEKIMQVQAENMRSYADGYSLFHNQKHLQAAKAIYGFLTQFLLSPEGAFYTSMDADLVKGKHSDWYFKLNDAERRKHGLPRIDKHVYARENGWAINGIVELYKVTGDNQYLKTAEKAANWVIANRQLPGGGFRHDDKDNAGPYLGDTLFMGRAFLNLYSATGDKKWLTHAEEAANFINEHFKQKTPGFTTAEVKPDSVSKPDPLLDENVSVARFTNLLARYSGKQEYKSMAENAMRYLATPEIARKRQILVAGILLADKEINTDPVHITVVGGKNDSAARALFASALKYPSSYIQVEWYDKAEGALPSATEDLVFPELPKAAAFGCAFKRCSLPIYKPENISKTIDSFSVKK